MGAAQGRAIRTVSDALTWGDEWVAAYAEMYDKVEALESQVFALQTRAVILEAEALLLRYDVAQALGRVYQCEVE